jgi:hypothetical protein
MALGAMYQPGAVPGDRKFVDVNGDGQVTGDDRVSLGKPYPQVFGGLNLMLIISHLILMYFFTVFPKQDLKLSRSRTSRKLWRSSEYQRRVLFKPLAGRQPDNNNRYTGLQMRIIMIIPAHPTCTLKTELYLRLRNIQVGYTLPSKLSSRASITRLRFLCICTKPVHYYNYSGLDPEIGLPQQYEGATRYGVYNGGQLSRSVGSSVVDVGTYPLSKIFTFGLNVTF